MATIRIVIVLALILFATVAGPETVGAQMPDTLQSGGTARVVAVIDGDTVILDDGRQV